MVKIAQLQRAEANLWAQLDAFTPTGDADLDTQWRTRLQQRFVQVAGQRRTLIGQLQATASQPAAPRSDPALIERLPAVQFDLLELPEALQRRLFDAFGLELRYHRPRHRLSLRATVRADTIEALQHGLRALTATGADATASAPPVSHVLRTPGSVRVHDIEHRCRRTS